MGLAISLGACLVIALACLKLKVYVQFFSGILPLDSEESGLCEVILVHEHYLGT